MPMFMVKYSYGAEF